MKKFMFAAIGLAICLFGLYCAIYYGGFYFDFNPNAPIEITAKTDSKTVLLKNQEGEFSPFLVKGVDLPSSIAGHFATDFAVEKETWLQWFEQIQEMGANTIRIYTIYDDVFYNAFYQFNKEKDTPLYLLQGLQVSDYANNSGKDAFGDEFYKQLKKDSLDVIDVLHGRKNIALNRMKGSGSYRRDVSPWVLGYVIGNEWESGTMAYTNHNRTKTASYQGDYFCTTEDASVFEAMLAHIMDDMVGYESEKYKTQKLISFLNSPEHDPFAYEVTYAKQLGKFLQMDAEHLTTTEKLQSGYFATYRLYEFCPGFSAYFSAEQKEKLADVLSRLDSGLYYQGYTQLLGEYHTIPVMITSYGFSSSRGTDSGEGPLTEQEQGERLVSVYNDIIDSGCQGACINSWQDVWERRTWNTSYAVDVDHADQWHDIQTDGQGYGLLSFEPGKGKSICYVDGGRTEWSEADEVLVHEGITLSAKYDARCLYLLLEGKEVSEQNPLYLPIDVTPKSGSRSSIVPSLRFGREADFLLCLEGRENSRLLVQARYEALRENYLKQTKGVDPFVEFPEVDSPDFVPIRMILKNQKLVEPNASEEELFAAKLADTKETGQLVYGNGNPASGAYNSLADFCFGENLVEVRIPWLLLNFSNASDMQVHDDYYKNYGVEWFQIEEIYIGICFAEEDKKTEMAALPLKGWGDKGVFYERLKESYHILKESWREG